jgi:hypothetical protein
MAHVKFELKKYFLTYTRAYTVIWKHLSVGFWNLNFTLLYWHSNEDKSYLEGNFNLFSSRTPRVSKIFVIQKSENVEMDRYLQTLNMYTRF